MRRKIIEADVIECVLGLGPNLFYNSPMEACIVLCRAAKPKVRKGHILFINAVGEVTRERAQSFLTVDHIERIAAAYRQFKDEPGFARVASLEEIRAKECSLSIPLYVGSSAANGTLEEKETASLAETLNVWLKSRSEIVEALTQVLPKSTPPRLEARLRGSDTCKLFKGRSKWPRARFGDVVENLNETERNPAQAGLERYIGLEHLEPGSLHIRAWGNVAGGTTFTRSCRPGQVLFGKRRAYQRKVAVAEFESVVSGDIYVLASKNDRLLPEILPFLCLSERFFQHAVETSAGSLSPRTNWSSLAGFEFDLPPLDQQRHIAEILWAVDEVVCRQEALVGSITAGIISERDNLFSKARQGKTESVGKLVEVQLGKMLSPKSKQGISPMPYLGNKNVQWGHFDLSEVQEMDFSPKEFQKFKLQPGDLLVCEGGEVGRSAIWEGQLESCCFQKAVHRLRPLDGRVTTEFMLEFMMWAGTKGLFSSLTGHSTIAHLTAVKLKYFPVPLVTGLTQQSFLERIRDFKHALRAVQKSRDETLRLRTELLNLIE